ncbi:MAG: hypothetical protein K0R39_4873 [Symbiobacteriaceae bacterium]|jgi:hypothetical protein|nr:hypothetical protein [Symbiobacteriaceae bacterium]
MQGRDSYEDELARRRRLRDRQTAPDGDPESGSTGDDEEIPKFGWKDVLAMCIAAYQLLFPILFALIGAMLLVWLLFKWFFKA